MSNYTQITYFGPKDSLPVGNPSKLILGTQVDTELGNIATAIASKFDSSSIAAGPVGFQAGTAAAPAVYLGSSAATGLFQPAANAIGVAVAGVQVGEWSSTGLAVTGTMSTTGAASIGGLLSVTGLAGNYGASLELADSSTSGTGGLLITDPLVGTGAGPVQQLTISATGNTDGANIRLLGNGATTPSKSIRVALGELQITNDAYDNVLLTLTDAGALTVAGALSVGTTLSVTGNATISGTTTITDSGGGQQTAGYLGVPFVTIGASHTFTLSDMGKAYQPTTSGLTFTIPANAVTAFPLGTVITIVCSGAGVTLAINSDTLEWFRGGTQVAGTRTIAPYSIVTVFKRTTTEWDLTGNGIS